ncbi:hypothetical protein LQF76_11030 [Gloeomargaritales cyanobacterium VI4D9]|jgi:hypothetical protein|nr:hypothetical protein LQF76_11030 [Gloeomargaritales cyanobacterium VI4D9]
MSQQISLSLERQPVEKLQWLVYQNNPQNGAQRLLLGSGATISEAFTKAIQSLEAMVQ